MVAGVAVARMPHTFSSVLGCVLASGENKGRPHLLWRPPDCWGYDRLLKQCDCSTALRNTHTLTDEIETKELYCQVEHTEFHYSGHIA